jgi:hypothetical protein
MLIEKDYCDYDTSVALKELGYVGICDAYYELTGSEDYNRDSFEILYTRDFIHPDDIDRVAAPLLYQAQKWLREEKEIHIEVYACAGGYIYELCKAYKPNSFSGGTTIYTPNDVDNPKLNDTGRYDDFETCLSEGIKEAVKILKEK